MPARRRTVARGCPPSRGFTLLELLVTLVLIGLVTSMAVLGIRTESPGERQQHEAQRLLARMDLAREEAVMRAQSLGLRLEDDRYRFVQLVDDQWRPLEGPGLPPHELSGELNLEIEVEGRDIVLGATGEDSGDNEAEHQPQVYFLAGGEVIPAFEIRLISDDTMTEYRVHPGARRWLALSRDEL